MTGIHNYQKRLERTTQRIKNSDTITDKDKKATLEFKDQCLLNVSISRTVRYMQSLRKLSKWMKVNFENAKKENIKKAVARIKQMDYPPWTKQIYKITLRKFYQWLEGNEWNSKKYPSKVEWISTTVKNNDKKLPDEILTEKEVKRLINSAEHARNRAFVATLYESGCRIGELLKLRIKQIEFDEGFL